MKTQTLFVSVFALVLLQACSSSTTAPFPAECAASIREEGGVFVSVLDSASGAPIGNAVSATAIDGRYFDAVTTPDSLTYTSSPIGLGIERVGKYDVYISKAGYRPWVAYNVVVKAFTCGPDHATVTAKLQSSGVPDSFRSAP